MLFQILLYKHEIYLSANIYLSSKESIIEIDLKSFVILLQYILGFY